MTTKWAKELGIEDEKEARAVLVKMYESGMSPSQILKATKSKVTSGHLRKMLRQYIKMRPRGGVYNVKGRDKLKELTYHEYLSVPLKELCKRYNTCTDSLYREIKRREWPLKRFNRECSCGQMGCTGDFDGTGIHTGDLYP